MSFVDLMKNDLWSDTDIANRARSTVASYVSEARQNELRTIMLGHIAGLRTATADELAEIMQVKALVEAAGDASRAAKADMALLHSAMTVERATARLSLPVVEDDEADAAEREAAQAVVDGAAVEVAALVALRNPVVEDVVAVPDVEA